MTISGDPAHGGSYNLASAGSDEPTVNVGFDVSRAFVGFVYGIMLVPQRRLLRTRIFSLDGPAAPNPIM